MTTKNTTKTAAADLMTELRGMIEKSNKDLIALIEIVHFYEAFKFEIELLIEHGLDHGNRIKDETLIKGIKFLKKAFNEAETQTEKILDTTLYELYQDQNIIKKEGTAKPVPRSTINSDFSDIEVPSKNKLN